jgi:prevent-host-death family protein
VGRSCAVTLGSEPKVNFEHQGKAPACWWREITLLEMCDNVHMKTISIRELHLKTGRWVRHAASRGPIVVTDRGRRVAALQPFDASMTGRPLPNREAAIRKRSKVPVDSTVYQSELREDR